MKRYLASLLAAHLGPAAAQQARNPLDYPLRDLLFILAMVSIGGLASWYRKVRRGELAATNMFALFGEAAVSALAGILAALFADYMGAPFAIMAAAAGLGGHAGAKALSVAETLAQRVVEKRLGIAPTAPAPLDQTPKE